jgi:hypothetical protein
MIYNFFWDVVTCRLVQIYMCIISYEMYFFFSDEGLVLAPSGRWQYVPFTNRYFKLIPGCTRHAPEDIKLQILNNIYRVLSESRCSIRLLYVDLVGSIDVAVDITSNTFCKCTANFPTLICCE